LCGEEIPPDYKTKQWKKPANKRNPVYPVRKLSVAENKLRLMLMARDRNDEYGRAIIHRVQSVSDLPAADAQYHFSCMKSLHQPQLSGKPTVGRPKDDVQGAMECIFKFLEESDEECQFTIEELMNHIEGDFRPNPKTVKARLLEKYEDDVLVTANMPYIVCFLGKGHKILSNAFYQGRLPKAEERLKVVKASAAIIVENVRSRVYDTTRYPPADEFMDGLEDLFPQSLKTFTDAIVMTKKRGDLDKWRKKSLALADCLLTAVRPRSYLSPLQVGIASFLYRKYGSRIYFHKFSHSFCTYFHMAV